jgi:hypothetical protein
LNAKIWLLVDLPGIRFIFIKKLTKFPSKIKTQSPPNLTQRSSKPQRFFKSKKYQTNVEAPFRIIQAPKPNFEGNHSEQEPIGFSGYAIFRGLYPRGHAQTPSLHFQQYLRFFPLQRALGQSSIENPKLI